MTTDHTTNSISPHSGARSHVGLQLWLLVGHLLFSRDSSQNNTKQLWCTMFLYRRIHESYLLLLTSYIEMYAVYRMRSYPQQALNTWRHMTKEELSNRCAGNGLWLITLISCLKKLHLFRTKELCHAGGKFGKPRLILKAEVGQGRKGHKGTESKN